MTLGKKSDKKFCSPICQTKWQTTLIGKLNSHYLENDIECEWCGKVFHVSKYKLNNQSHFFCSIECKHEWFAKVWSQDENWKKESRIRAARLLSNGSNNHTNTKPQIAVNKILDTLQIDYINEYNIRYYCVDNYLPKQNIAFEIQGDYWHCNPIIYNKSMNQMQFNRIKKDKAKHTYIKKYYNFSILYLWESDIIDNEKLVQLLISEFIKNRGILNNYNSFNYHIENGSLVINKNIIYSYQEQNVNNYNNMIKQIS